MAISTLNGIMSRKPIVYDLLLSVLYLWSVSQMYIYDAKQKSGLVIYIVIYGIFTLLVRSPFGALLMNVLSGYSLFWMFKLPIMQQAGAYFKFGIAFGIAMTFIVLCVQVLLSDCILIWGRTFLNRSNQFSWSAAGALISAMAITVMALSVR